MLEPQIISACMMDRGCFNLVEKYIENKDIGPETQKILGIIRGYYERDPTAQACDRELVETSIFAGIPEHLDKHKEIFRAYLARVPREVSVPNLSQYIIELKQDRIAHELHQALLSKSDRQRIDRLIDKWRELRSFTPDDKAGAEVYTGWDVGDLVGTHFDPKNLIRLLPKALNDRCDGGAKPGHHIYVFALTEMGKTLFVVNLVYGFLKQNLRVLVIGNEEPIADWNMRLVNRMTGMTKNEVKSDPDRATSILSTTKYSNFTIAGMSPGRFSDVRDLCAELDPHVVVLDQLGNMDMGATDGKTVQLLKAATEARQLGKSESRLIVSVGQASDDAYNRPILRRNDIQWSNVDVPGQLDLQIGIGANEEMEQQGLRRISLPKNKLGGKHDWFDVRFIPEYSRVEELAA